MCGLLSKTVLFWVFCSSCFLLLDPSMETSTSFEGGERRPACSSEDAGMSTATSTKSSSHASNALDLVGLKDPSPGL